MHRQYTVRSVPCGSAGWKPPFDGVVLSWKVCITEGRKVIADNLWGHRHSAGEWLPVVAEYNRDPVKLAEAWNFRFWQFVNNGWVKLTLRPGQQLTHRKSYDNGEGWSWEAATWMHEGEGVRLKWGEGGRDCDGPSSSHGEGFCHRTQLQAQTGILAAWDPRRWLPPSLARFTHESGGQHDAYAEAAGY